MEHFKLEPLSKFYRPKDTILTWAMSPIFMWRWKWVARNVLKFSGISSTLCLIFPRISPSPTFCQPSRRPFSPAFFKWIQSILCWSSILQSLVSQHPFWVKLPQQFPEKYCYKVNTQLPPHLPCFRELVLFSLIFQMNFVLVINIWQPRQSAPSTLMYHVSLFTGCRVVTLAKWSTIDGNPVVKFQDWGHALFSWKVVSTATPPKPTAIS